MTTPPVGPATPAHDAVRRGHLLLVEAASDALFVAAATAAIATLAAAAVVTLVGGWPALLTVVVAVPSPLLAASLSLGAHVSKLERRAQRGQTTS